MATHLSVRVFQNTSITLVIQDIVATHLLCQSIPEHQYNTSYPRILQCIMDNVPNVNNNNVGDGREIK